MVSTLESRRRFSGYIGWSSKFGDIWDEANNISNAIGTTKLTKENKGKFRDQLSELKTDLDSLCSGIERANWFNVEVDFENAAPKKINVEGFFFGELPFETLCANTNKLIDKLEAELEETPPLPDTYDFIGTDSSDGSDLYYDENGKEYVKMIDTLDESEADWMKDGEFLKELKRNEFLTIEITYSLETDAKGGDFKAEITVSTKVKGMDSEDIKKIEKHLLDLANENRISGLENIESDVVLKIGASYTLGGRSSEYPKVDLLTEKTHPNKRDYGERTISLRRFLK